MLNTSMLRDYEHRGTVLDKLLTLKNMFFNNKLYQPNPY